jgi:hypothetical protein
MFRKKYENCCAVLWTVDYKTAIIGCFKVPLLIGAEESYENFNVVEIPPEY